MKPYELAVMKVVDCQWSLGLVDVHKNEESWSCEECKYSAEITQDSVTCNYPE